MSSKSVYTLFACLIGAFAFNSEVLAGDAVPASYSAELTQVSKLPWLNVPRQSVDAAKAKAAAADAPGNKPQPTRWAVAVPLKANATANGVWEETETHAIWRLPINTESALMLSLQFTDVSLPDSAVIWFYSTDLNSIRGPYSRDSFGGSGSFATAAISGQSGILEINVPKGQTSDINLTVSKVYSGIVDFSKDSSADKSGSCNVDVACSTGDGFLNQIRSVARYTIGQFLCSGSLVNNTSGDLTPYFLTANHCLSTSAEATSTVFYWNYQTTSCGGPRNGNLNQSQSGATLVATNSNSDFTLLRLNARPSAAFNVFYSGWDRRNQTHTNVTGIHHPSGDEKRISVDFDSTTITDYTSNSTDSNADYLRVAAWDIGTTEGGSSGSPLYSSGKLVVGTLSGGSAACAGSVDNNQPDWYGRMYAHFTAPSGIGLTPGNLANALDPSSSGAQTLEGKNHDGTTGGSSGGGNGGSVGGGSSGGGGGGSTSLMFLLLLSFAAAARQTITRYTSR